MNESENYYRPSEAAKRIGITPSYLAQLVRENKVQASGATARGHRRYNDNDIQQAKAYMAGQLSADNIEAADVNAATQTVPTFGEVAELVTRFKHEYAHLPLGSIRAKSFTDRRPIFTVHCPRQYHAEITQFEAAEIHPVDTVPAGVAISSSRPMSSPRYVDSFSDTSPSLAQAAGNLMMVAALFAGLYFASVADDETMAAFVKGINSGVPKLFGALIVGSLAFTAYMWRHIDSRQRINMLIGVAILTLFWPAKALLVHVLSAILNAS